MNKVVVGAAVLAVVTGGSVGLAAWSGPQVARGVQERAAQWARAFPNVQVVDQQVTTGLMNSTHEITLQAGCVPAGGAAPGDTAPQPLKITFRDHIQHGPFPGGRSVGLAAIDSELVLPPQAAAQVAKLMGQQSVLRAHTVLGFGGGYVSEVSSPAFKFEETDKGRMEWQGLKMEVRGSLEGGLSAGTAYTLEAPGLTLDVAPAAGPATSLKVGRFSMKGDVTPGTEPGLWIMPNKGTATLSSIEVVTQKPAVPGAAAKAVKVLLDDLRFSSESTIDKGLLSAVSQFSGKGRVDEFAVDKVEMQIALRRLHAATYQQMVTRQMDALLSCGQPADRATQQQAAMEELKAAAATLFRHDPEYALDKFAVELGGQRAELAYSVGTRGVTEADSALPLSELLGTRGYANASLKVQNGWIEQFAQQMAATAIPSTQPDAEANRKAAQAQTVAFANMMIDNFAGKGFLVRDGDGIKAAAKFEAGQLQVNGKPVPLPPLPGLGLGR
jgi:uncharacterized protein YdgA (DUF945 family)